jgi:hypothetical protein
MLVFQRRRWRHWRRCWHRHSDRLRRCAAWRLQGTQTAVSGQVFADKHYTTTSGPCIVVPTGVTNVTIRDSEIGPCGSSSHTVDDVGVSVTGTYVTITRNVIHHAASAVRITDSINGHAVTKNLIYAPRPAMGW